MADAPQDSKTPSKKDLTSLLELSEMELAPDPAPVEILVVDTAAEGFQLPSISQIGVNENAVGELSYNDVAPLEGIPAEGDPSTIEPATASVAMAINEDFPDNPQPVPQLAEASLTRPNLIAPTPTPIPTAESDSESETESGSGSLSISDSESDSDSDPVSNAKTVLDPNRPAVHAAPAGFSHTLKSAAPTAAKHDLTAVKNFGDRIAIGRPNIEGAPAFSLLARSTTGRFEKKAREGIEAALTSENFGLRLEDVEIQLTAGKLLVPQISEFAAVTLAQKLRDFIEEIEVDLAGEIFEGPSADNTDEPILLDTEEFESHREEIRDMAAEPRAADDLFSTNMPELRDFQVTRVLSVVTASKIISPEAAENPTSKDFEDATEKLTEDLIARAFKLGAHGVLGVSFTLRAIESSSGGGDDTRSFRLLGSGTAVRVRRKS